MQTYDIVMIVVLAIATIFGAIKGFAWQIASLASIIFSYIVAYTFRDEVAKMIHAQEPWNGFLAMLLLYAGSSFAIWVLFRLISGAIDKVRLRDFDRHMGALLGLAKGVVYCLLITMFAVSLLGPKQQQAIVESRSGGYISKILSATDGIMWPKEIEQVVRPYLKNLEQKLEQRGSTVAGQSPFGGTTNPDPSANGGFLSNVLEAGKMLSGSPSQNNPSSEQGGRLDLGKAFLAKTVLARMLPFPFRHRLGRTDGFLSNQLNRPNNNPETCSEILLQDKNSSLDNAVI